MQEFLAALLAFALLGVALTFARRLGRRGPRACGSCDACSRDAEGSAGDPGRARPERVEI